MSRNNPAAQSPDIFQTLLQLAEQMKENPQGIDRELVRRGDQLLGVFHDENYGLTFKDLRTKKRYAIEMVAKDISEGALTLQTSSIGVSFTDGKMLPFITPMGTPAKGTVVFSLNWKDTKAFQNWRDNEQNEISQDDINTSLYRLAVILSEVI